MRSHLNLATRPLLNTAPLYLILGTLAVLAAGLTAWNAALFLNTRSEARAVESQLAELDLQEQALLDRRVALGNRLRDTDLGALGDRVNAANIVLAEKSVSWGLLLERLQEVVPWRVRLDSIRTSVKKDAIGLALDLRTEKHDYYWDFIEKLEAHECFSDVYPSQQTDLDGGEIEVILQLKHDPWCGEVAPNAPQRHVKAGRRSRGGSRG
jgi:hypothetical protein